MRTMTWAELCSGLLWSICWGQWSRWTSVRWQCLISLWIVHGLLESVNVLDSKCCGATRRCFIAAVLSNVATRGLERQRAGVVRKPDTCSIRFGSSRTITTSLKSHVSNFLHGLSRNWFCLNTLHLEEISFANWNFAGLFNGEWQWGWNCTCDEDAVIITCASILTN